LRKENSGKIGENRDRLRKSEKRREKEREERRENRGQTSGARQSPFSREEERATFLS